MALRQFLCLHEGAQMVYGGQENNTWGLDLVDIHMPTASWPSSRCNALVPLESFDLSQFPLWAHADPILGVSLSLSLSVSVSVFLSLSLSLSFSLSPPFQPQPCHLFEDKSQLCLSLARYKGSVSQVKLSPILLYLMLVRHIQKEHDFESKDLTE